MATADVRNAVSRLLVALGAPTSTSRTGEVDADAELLAICMDVYSTNASRTRPAWSADVLTQVLRTLISAGAPGAKRIIEACFMELVKRVRAYHSFVCFAIPACFHASRGRECDCVQDNGSLAQLLAVVAEIIQSAPLAALLTGATASLDQSASSTASRPSSSAEPRPRRSEPTSIAREDRPAAPRDPAPASIAATSAVTAAPSSHVAAVPPPQRGVAVSSLPPPARPADSNLFVRMLREGATPAAVASGTGVGPCQEMLDRACFGDRIVLRALSADGPGFLAADAAGTTGSRASGVSTSGGGVGAATEVFELLPADGATTAPAAWKGHPVRCGDAILLRCVSDDRYVTAGSAGGGMAAYRDVGTAARSVVLADAASSSSKWAILSLSALQHAIASPSASRPFIRRADDIVLVAHAGSLPLPSASPDDAREAALRMEVLTAAVHTSRVTTTEGEGVTLRIGGVVVDNAFASPGAGDALSQALDVGAMMKRGDDSNTNAAVALLAANHGVLQDAARSGIGVGPSAALPLLLATVPPACITWSMLCVLPQPLTSSPHPFSLPPRPSHLTPHALRDDDAHILRRAQPTEPLAALASLPAAAVEALLVEHILSALTGAGGAVIQPGPDDSFVLAPLATRRGLIIDETLITLTTRLLPVASAAQRCRTFIDACALPHCSGRVRQAVAASLRIVLREYTALLQQLAELQRKTTPADAAHAREAMLAPPVAWVPSSSLTLHQLWFYLQPAARTLADLDVIMQRLASAHGGDILTRLCALASESGSDSVRVLSKLMLEHGSAPYLRMLESWMYAGELNDPHAEFMIADAENDAGTGRSGRPATDIMSRFTIREEMIPIFLRPHAAGIQHAGKYLNILRLCADAAAPRHAASSRPTAAASANPAAARLWRVSPHACTIRFSVDSEAYTAAVTAAATFASRSVLEYFALPASRGGLDLFGRLASLKGFFLLARGDYLNHFLDTASSELAKEVALSTAAASSSKTGNTVLLHRLRGQLELALRSSTATHDAYAAAVTCALAPSSLLARLDSAGARLTAVTGLKGYNVFELRYEMPWPMSLLFAPTALERYQHLFRHLFFCRYVEKAVADCWIAHQSCKELDMRATLALSFTLRQRMLHFLQNLQYFMHVEVIEPRWHELLDRVAAANNIDDVVSHHGKFLSSTLAECLLTSPDLLKLLTKLITLCLLFAEQISNSIESHRLTTAELDRLAGVNKASERARVQLERGEYYDVEPEDDENSDAKSTVSRASAITKRRSSRQLDAAARRAARAVKPTASELRIRRKTRLAAQTDAMRHTMAQRGWQAMIEKSSRMFDALLRDFLLALLDRTRMEYTSHAANLCARLDYNGFYSAHLGLVGLDTSGSA